MTVWNLQGPLAIVIGLAGIVGAFDSSFITAIINSGTVIGIGIVWTVAAWTG